MIIFAPHFCRDNHSSFNDMRQTSCHATNLNDTPKQKLKV